MHWPSEHPVHQDGSLAGLIDAADELCPDARAGHVLRHVPGRRMAVFVDTSDGPGVLKMFATPRARGNHRRLAMLAGTSASPCVPTSRGCDRTGHVGLVSWQPGRTLHDLTDDEWASGCAGAGAALAMLHASGATFDRAWSAADECEHLRRFADGPEGGLIARADSLGERLDGDELVSAHRDFHPKQVVIDAGDPHLIDLDDAAMAPAALDVGNFLAHLTQEAVLGLRPRRAVDTARAGFLESYGDIDADIEVWEWLTLLRLAALARTRHARPDWCRALLQHANREVPA